MKAPDKIYMPNELLSEEWQRHIEGEDTVYIRKDALLEWAKGQASITEKLNGKGAMLKAWDALIDKIESL